MHRRAPAGDLGDLTIEWRGARGAPCSWSTSVRVPAAGISPGMSVRARVAGSPRETSATTRVARSREGHSSKGLWRALRPLIRWRFSDVYATSMHTPTADADSHIYRCAPTVYSRTPADHGAQRRIRETPAPAPADRHPAPDRRDTRTLHRQTGPGPATGSRRHLHPPASADRHPARNPRNAGAIRGPPRDT